MTEEERTLEFLINNDGKPFTMLEQSIVIGRLINFGWKVTDIVKKTGKARGYIENLITLTKTPMVVQNYMKDDKISAHAVIGIMAAEKDDPEAVVTEVEKAIKNAVAIDKDGLEAGWLTLGTAEWMMDIGLIKTLGGSAGTLARPLLPPILYPLPPMTLPVPNEQPLEIPNRGGAALTDETSVYTKT